MEILITPSHDISIDQQPVEFVERKGIGHPDSLCDGIAESISSSYSRYCLDKFGVVPNHWVDKCMLIGGECERDFGKGKILYPLNFFVVGKVTHSVGDVLIPFEEISRQAIHHYLQSVFDLIKPDKDVCIHFHTNSAVGAGRRKTWYRPESIDDLLKLPKRTSNDAVICVGYAPLSQTENIVLLLERYLNSKSFKKQHPEIGTDIKVIGNRHQDQLTLTLCIPFISTRTPSRKYYEDKKIELKKLIYAFVKEHFRFQHLDVHINTRDDQETIYMTHLGSAADTGDVGVVGRGNRMNGLISPCREMSIEAPCGKNPIYHAGKLYGVLAQAIADRIYLETGLENSIHVTSETGSELSQPHFIGVKLVNAVGKLHQGQCEKIVREECQNIERIQNQIIQQAISMF